MPRLRGAQPAEEPAEPERSTRSSRAATTRTPPRTGSSRRKTTTPSKIVSRKDLAAEEEETEGRGKRKAQQELPSTGGKRLKKKTEEPAEKTPDNKKKPTSNGTPSKSASKKVNGAGKSDLVESDSSDSAEEIVLVVKPDGKTKEGGEENSSEDGIVYSDSDESVSVEEVGSSSDSEVVFTSTPPMKKKQLPQLKVQLGQKVQLGALKSQLSPKSPQRTTEAAGSRSPAVATVTPRQLGTARMVVPPQTPPQSQSQPPVNQPRIVQLPVSNTQPPQQFVILPGSSGVATAASIPGNINNQASLANNLLVAMQKMKESYDAKLQQKDLEVLRLRNSVRWKDEQLKSLTSLMEKNVELESRLTSVLTEPKTYDMEVKLFQTRKRQREQDEEENIRKAKEAKLEQQRLQQERLDEMQRQQKQRDEEEEEKRKAEEQKKKKEEEGEKKKNEAEKDDDDLEIVYDSKETRSKRGSSSKKSPKGKEKAATTPRRGRRSRRGKKEEEEPEEEIETLFVSDDEDDEAEEGKGKSRKKGKKGEEKEKDKEKENGEEEDDDDEKNKGRHNIRKVMTTKKLTTETKTAAKAEKERRERVEEAMKSHIRLTQKDNKKKQEITTKLVLATKADKKTPLVEVNNKLIRKLKSHQVDAVEFMWNCVIESMEWYRGKNPVYGCILAHRMGLGKTLSVVTLVHTLLTSRSLRFKTCLVVCPLNTVLNWMNEWEKWLDKKDRLDTYEMASCKNNQERAELLSEWKETGGIMIMGYQLFRILANHPTKSKRRKKIFNDTLLDPGPDIVVCDEGHVLKNDGSMVAQCMNRIRSKRRIVLTGTPLQNNLIEYHCMVNFVRPNLIGTRKEFSNRFVNPITNGQHSDSTPYDVKLMKKRAHVLHEMLDSVVQRRDYSHLTKLLPAKYEYVIAVRLSAIQIKLYETYLEQEKSGGGNGNGNKGAGLFTDYQALMRIWTHPWVLKLDEIRQEKKITYDSDSDSEFADSDDEVVTISDSSDIESDSEESESGKEDQTSKSKGKSKKEDSSKKDKESAGKSSKEKAPEEEEEGAKRSQRIRLRKKEAEKEEENSKSSSKTGKDAKKGTKTEKLKKKDSKKDNKSSKNKSNSEDSSKKPESPTDEGPSEGQRKSKLIAGEVIRQWSSTSRGAGWIPDETERKKREQWWASMVSEEDEKKLELSGKLVLLFEIIRLSETLGDKVLVFSQSILSLDLIEAFLSYKNEEAKAKKSTRKSAVFTHWEKDEDYIRMDGSTGALKRKGLTTAFNDPKNKRLRLFLISTRAGGLGINLDCANRVVIFDASWNPSHDVQSIFRVYRFGQEKQVYVYRMLAQGTMEEKIYERQITKETLSQRVIDEHQLDRHFTASDLAELYHFTPDRLDDPNRKERPTPKLPEDLLLRELLSSQKEWIVQYHEHDSLLEKRPDEDLTEEERKAAWEEYEKEKAGLVAYPVFHGNVGTIAHMPVASVGPTMNYQVPYRGYFQNISYPRPAVTVLPPPAPSPDVQFNFLQPGIPHPLAGHMGVAALPKVVQEILKFNPNISPSDLQHRLQAFLGMHGNRAGMPLLPTTGPPANTVATTLPISQASQPSPSVSAIPASIVIPPEPMPSRLPVPGLVPATKK